MMDQTQDGTQQATQGRRDFMKLALVSTPVVAAGVIVGGEAAASTASASQGLRDTDHTRAYFETARF